MMRMAIGSGYLHAHVLVSLVVEHPPVADDADGSRLPAITVL